MLFCEFQEGTGCRDNAYNHKVYRDLEVMYMNSNISKQEIYEYGKKLVDNSKTEEELKLEREINEKIESLKAEIDEEKSYIEWKEDLMAIAKECGDKEMVQFYRNVIKSCKDRIKSYKQEIAALKWVLA